MKIALRISGGFANLRIQGEVDTSELSPELARRIEEGLASDRLRAAADSHDPRMTDGQIYELTILPETEDGELRRFVIDDSTVEVEILDVLDELLHEIVRRKSAPAPEEAETAETAGTGSAD